MNENDSKRKNDFIDVAEKLFKENGIMDTTINAIVKELDVAKGLFYYYFKSKDDVIDAICEKYNESFRSTLNKDDSLSFEQEFEQLLESAIVSFQLLWKNLNDSKEDADLTILSYRAIKQAKTTCTTMFVELFEKHRDHISASPNYLGKMIVSSICDLVEQGDNNIDEIKSILRKMIQKKG